MPAWTRFPALSTYKVKTPPRQPVGTYAGVGGGTAVVTEEPDLMNPGKTIRKVTYNNYVNVLGEVLNGSEYTSTDPTEVLVRYVADINVTGAHVGYLRGDVTINQLSRTITPTTAGSMIRSSGDGDVLVLLDQARYEDALQNT